MDRHDIEKYLDNSSVKPLFLPGDSLEILKKFPDECIDVCLTSPPYWGKRQYNDKGIGLENSYEIYIDNLLDIFKQVKRVLKKTGSFWLNLGDKYENKRLLGLPWRVALKLIDNQEWILRNEIIWNKVKGGLDSSKDRLGNVHEQLFHFVKIKKGYYYDVDSIRKEPKEPSIENGSVKSATGVTGVKYKGQIKSSNVLTSEEKKNALSELENRLNEIKNGELSDFRMVIKGEQRTTHSNSKKLSGRAKELDDKGFYFLKYHKNGSKPRDVWDIIPEDTQNRGPHYAPYPEDLCKIPIKATCPSGGIVLDPFSGTGTTMVVSKKLGRKSIGIDISDEYIEIAKKRCKKIL